MNIAKLSSSLAVLLMPCTLMAIKQPQPAVQEAVYLDFGLSFGSNIWPYIDWSQSVPVVKEDQMDQYLASLFSQMKAAGQMTVYLAFSQLVNLDMYYRSDFKPYDPPIAAYDVIGLLLQSLQKSGVSVPNFTNFFQYFMDQAHKNEMKVALSFGGGSAPAEQFKILQNAQATYDGQATRLYQFMESFGIDSVDFDMEVTDCVSSQALDPKGQTVVTFFKTLHDLLSAKNKKSTLTIMADTNWAKEWLKPLFYNGRGAPIFTTLFHGLNLMAYSDDRYWLDPSDSGWGIEQWLDILGKGNAGMLNIGFDDQVLYSGAAANGGHYQYTIQPGSTDGQAAAQIYLQLQAKLASDGYTSKLGVPFYWPSMNVKPNGENRYQTTGNRSNFVSKPMQDFSDWLNSHQQFTKCREAHQKDLRE